MILGDISCHLGRMDDGCQNHMSAAAPVNMRGSNLKRLLERVSLVKLWENYLSHYKYYKQTSFGTVFSMIYFTQVSE